MRLIADTINYTVKHVPKWNPTNICSYHLQEAGATPVQELAYALCTAMAVLDRVKASGEIKAGVSAGRRAHLVLRQCRHPLRRRVLQAARLRRNVGRADAEPLPGEDPKLRRFRYGVQVNSLGLTEPQPENNVQRIVLEMLAVVLSKNAPGPRHPAAGLERGHGPATPVGPAMGAAHAAGDGFETDLLEYGDILDGSPVIAAKVKELIEGAQREIANVEAQGGIIAAIESGYIKRELVAAAT
jgi:(2R)-ethylmalonyl-CoA mutase